MNRRVGKGSVEGSFNPTLAALIAINTLPPIQRIAGAGRDRDMGELRGRLLWG